MGRSPIARRAALLAGAAAVLAACGSSNTTTGSGGGSSSAASAGPYRVLAILSETGTSAAFGSGAHAALQYTADQLNKAGGIMNRQIQIDFLDDQGDAVRATQLLNRALATTHYDMIDAGTVSDTNIAMRPAIGQANVLTFTTSGGIDVDVTKDPTLFVVSPEVTASSAATVSYVVNTLKAKKVALLTVNNSTGVPNKTFYESHFAKYGVDVVSSQTLAPTAVDATPQLVQMRSANPDIVLVSVFGAQAGTVAKDIAQLNWNVPVVGDLLAGASNLSGLVSPSVLKNWTIEYFTAFTRPQGGQPSQPLVSFVDGITSIAGALKASTNAYTGTHDMLILAKYAVEKTKSTDGRTDAKALEQIADDSSAKSLPFLTYPEYAFTPTVHSPFDPANIPGDVNPYFAMGAAASSVVSGTIEKVADIPTGPVKVTP